MFFDKTTKEVTWKQWNTASIKQKNKGTYVKQSSACVLFNTYCYFGNNANCTILYPYTSAAESRASNDSGKSVL